MNPLIESLRIYNRFLYLILPFALFGILSTLLLILAPYPTFFAMGGLFLRTYVAGELGLYDMAISFLMILLGALSASLMFILITNLVYGYLTKAPSLYRLLRERVEKHTGRLFLYFLSIPLLALFLQLVALYTSWEWVAVVGMLLYAYATFFIPYALAVEDLSWRKAVKKALYLLRRHGEIPLLWGLVVAVALFAITAATYLLLKEWAGLASFLINTIFLLPYSVVLAAVLYVKRYPIVGRA